MPSVQPREVAQKPGHEGQPDDIKGSLPHERLNKTR